MLLLAIAVLLLVVSAALSLFIHVHAFRRSMGTAVMTLFVPGYVVFYAFSQFEHARKGPIVAGWLGLGMLAGVLAGGAAHIHFAS